MPGMTIVCGDSHTATHGAFGALAFGIGTSEVEHVLATQCLLQRKSRTMLVSVDGQLGQGVTAKDIVDFTIEKGAVMLGIQDMRWMCRNVMAREKSLFHGHPVAAVAADSQAIAAEACKLADTASNVAAKGGAWFATRSQIADHWAANHPHQRYDRPSQMDAETFVAKYGSIFEHSPWIAERAHALELGPAHDTATGLHNALARMFRSATQTERLGVLTAHPDLAGKLAQAKRLTAESTHEQSAAGLDALTDAERESFQRLNADYVAKHGFPFIIAVRDNTKASIMAAFETRIANDTTTEFATACRQVERIAEIRLKDLLP